MGELIQHKLKAKFSSGAPYITIFQKGGLATHLEWNMLYFHEIIDFIKAHTKLILEIGFEHSAQLARSLCHCIFIIYDSGKRGLFHPSNNIRLWQVDAANNFWNDYNYWRYLDQALAQQNTNKLDSLPLTKDFINQFKTKNSPLKEKLNGLLLLYQYATSIFNFLPFTLCSRNFSSNISTFLDFTEA